MEETTRTVAIVLLLVGLVFTWNFSRKGMGNPLLFLAALSAGIVYTAGNLAGYRDASLGARAIATMAYGICLAAVWHLSGGAWK